MFGQDSTDVSSDQNPGLFSVYRGLYYPVKDPEIPIKQSVFHGSCHSRVLLNAAHVIYEKKNNSSCVPGSINSHYFHIIGDGHQPNSRGLYTHYKDSN